MTAPGDPVVSARAGHAGLFVCSVCRRLRPGARVCSACGAPAGTMLALSHALAYAVAQGHLGADVGAMSYPGDRQVCTAAIALLLVVPAAGAIGFIAGDVATVALLVSLIGLPVLAFVDARRAGAARARAAAIAALVPHWPGWQIRDDPDASTWRSGLVCAIPRAGASARAIQVPLADSRAGQAGDEVVATRLDLRAGPAAEPVGHHEEHADFIVVFEDGEEALVTGEVHLGGVAYDDVAALAEADKAGLAIAGVSVAVPVRAAHRAEAWACQIALCHGDRVEVLTGAVCDDRVLHPLGASYRDPATVGVLRGERGRPLLVRRRAGDSTGESSPAS